MTFYTFPGDGIPLPTDLFQEWCEDAELENLSYSRSRRTLWDRLTMIAKFGRVASKKEDGFDVGSLFAITYSDWYSLKSALTSKQEMMTDDKRLAFDTAISSQLQKISSLLQSEPEERKGSHQKVAVPQPIVQQPPARQQPSVPRVPIIRSGSY